MPYTLTREVQAIEKVGKAGNFISIACAIHCMLVPLLFVLLPVIGAGFVLSGWFEFTILGVAIGISLFSLCWGFRVHRKTRVFALLAVAICFFFLAEYADSHVVFSILGGASLIAANYTNSKLCRSCSTCGCHHEHTGQ